MPSRDDRNMTPTWTGYDALSGGEHESARIVTLFWTAKALVSAKLKELWRTHITRLIPKLSTSRCPRWSWSSDSASWTPATNCPWWAVPCATCSLAGPPPTSTSPLMPPRTRPWPWSRNGRTTFGR
ncbi:hypothetical protein ARTHRO8AJ_10057 [Arthrobacter sp. 8AJ]|nr:hypothetical protein ARTHRO8AJ_10057 [Arthrobacter sp. 8AJ]